MYKVLITTTAFGSNSICVHTQIVDFNSKDGANQAIDAVKNARLPVSISVHAIPLF